ncbi:DUF5074 domain-containing protein [Coprobacter tertius]|uniref:Immunoglobulin domain-containing protein n=1 Tax=Coprobacter tertius TaxID=2944915 RepID=A0ABT1ML93_9BACT|nr:DUF5074 domain-containing protein [Coprobacter tertius]MCP9612473.1 immunoglobulin domain-containing protein [Coprobacter tertius]
MKKIYFLLASFLLCIGLQAQQTPTTVQGHPYDFSRVKTQTPVKKPGNLKGQTDLSFTMDKIENWTGKGAKRAALVVQWFIDKGEKVDTVALVWGYRWDGEATGANMIEAIAKADPRFYILGLPGTQYGMAVGGIGYDADKKGEVALIRNGITKVELEQGVFNTSGYDFDDYEAADPNDYFFSGWLSKGFWNYRYRDNETKIFENSNIGASSRFLVDGSWDLWVPSINFSFITDESVCSKFTPAPAVPEDEKPIDYKQGMFLLNEDWFGHSNSTINFLDADGKWNDRVFRRENPGKELGCTSQFGTIYANKVFIVSKQAKDNSSEITGGRLTVAKASTLKSLAQFETVGDGDGRAFVGVDDNTGYVSTTKGIYLFDIANLQIGNIITGTEDTESNVMLRAGDYVFAINNTKGILVIDPQNHTITKTIEGSYSSIIQSSDGSVWASVKSTAELLKINPYTLTTENVTIPAAVATNFAWNLPAFWASNKTNTLYWKASGTTLYKYEIGSSEPSNTPFIDITGNEGGYSMYGTGFRLDPETEDIYLVLNKGWENNATVWKYDINGTKQAEYPLEQYYWFPAMPIFPDKYEPVISKEMVSKIVIDKNSEPYTYALDGLVSDDDNLNAGIIKTLTYNENEFFTAVINAGNLIITPKTTAGKENITLKFNSNGKTVNKTISVAITEAPVITAQPESVEAVIDEKATFKVTATGGELTYQWYANGEEIKGKTSSTYSVTAGDENNNTSLYCIVKNESGETKSETVILTTKYIVPEITKQPASIERTVGGWTAAQFNVTARGGNLTYQWYKDEVAIEGATTARYSIAGSNLKLTDAGKYYCAVTNSLGTTNSDIAILTVKPAKPSITEQPTAVNVSEGETITLSVTANGELVTYQWYKDEVALESKTSDKLIIESASLNDAGNYYCTVSNVSGSVTSNKVEVKVTPKAPEITAQPVDVSVKEGEKISLSIEVTGTDISYQWFKDEVAIADAASNIFEIASATKDDAGEYYCVVTNTTASVTSDKVKVTINNLDGLDATKARIVQVFPNPAVSYINVKAAIGSRISIIDNKGSQILETLQQSETETINIEGLSNGVYFIRIIGNNQAQVVKLIKR